MAKILLGGVISNAAGKLAGSVFHSDLSGSRIITKHSGRKVKSFRSQAGNGGVAAAARGWRRLTDAQRARWSAVAGVGGSGGYTAYMQVNAFLVASNSSLVLVPPVKGIHPVFVGWQSFSFSGTTLSAVVNFSGSFTGFTVAVYLSKPYLKGRSLKSASYRFRFNNSISGTTSLITTNPDFINLFGYGVQVGYSVTMKIVLKNFLTGAVYETFYNTATRLV